MGRIAVTEKLFEAALGVTPPWFVAGVEFNAAARTLSINIDFVAGSRFALPGVAGEHPVHDTVSKRYRHLNFFQHECFLEVRVPRVKLPDGSVRQVEPGWAGGPSLGTVTLHWIDPQTGSREVLEREITTADFGPDYYRASSSFRVAATVAGFAEILRQSPYAGGYTLTDVSREAAGLVRELPGHADVAEFSELASTAARLAPGGVNHW
jgi:hypothetical protein